MLQNPQLNHPDERETRKPALADHFNVGCCQVIRTCTRANKPGIAVWDMCKRMVQHEASCRCQVYTITVAADGGSGCAEATGVTMSCALVMEIARHWSRLLRLLRLLLRLLLPPLEL